MLSDFETSRLRVADWSPHVRGGVVPDWLNTALVRMLTPDVLKHLPPPLQLSGGPDQIAEWVQQQSQDGMTFLILGRASGAVLGLLITASFEDGQGGIDTHIGYLFDEQAWGQGFATELLLGFVAAVPAGRGVRLIGGVGLDNPGSARVLQKAGFRRDAAMSSSDTDMFVLQVR